MAEVREFFYLRLTEIVALDGVSHFFVLRLDAGNVEADVLEDLHGSTPGGNRIMWRKVRLCPTGGNRRVGPFFGTTTPGFWTQNARGSLCTVSRDKQARRSY